MNMATAFAPGHISGFFQPVYHKNIYQTGSRGAGINLTLGVKARVQIERNSKQTIEIYVNNRQQKEPVVSSTVKQLIQDKPLYARIDLYFELPISQGFGMSAAGALSSSLALSSLLDLPSKHAWMAAHKAEVELKTGLGDVVAQIYGGIEIRKSSGIPPWGEIIKIPGDINIVCCTIDSNISTSKVLSNQALNKSIQLIGKQCTNRLLQNPTLEHFFKLSQEFTKNSGVASNQILEVIDQIMPFGLCSMCMLGNAVFAVGDTEKIKNILSGFGSVIQCTIDQQGARLI